MASILNPIDPIPAPVPVPLPIPKLTPVSLTSDTTPDPYWLDIWRGRASAYGTKHAANLRAAIEAWVPGTPADNIIGRSWYDLPRVVDNLIAAKIPGDWGQFHADAIYAYRDRYVLAQPTPGAVPGYYNQTYGLLQHYLRTGDPKSQAAVIALSKNAAYAVDTAPAAGTSPVDLSREVAYTSNALIDAQIAGAPYRPRLSLLISQMYGHLGQWFGPGRRDIDHINPFMVVITFNALRRAAEYGFTPISKFKSVIEEPLQLLWKELWDSASGSFLYADRQYTSGGGGGRYPAPDLDLYIAPMYAWAYATFGIKAYALLFDRLVQAACAKAFFSGIKQFNEAFHWSLDGMRWRGYAI